MKKEHDPIKALLERFFEGQTTVNEEQELYRFFTKADLPEELAHYKPVIQYFENGLAEDLGVMPSTTGVTRSSMQVSHDSMEVKRSSKRKRRIVWSSVAASILIMLLSSLYFFRTTDSSDPFEGSYIIRNGERITDLNLIRPELEATIQKALLQEQETDQLVEKLSTPDFGVDIQIIAQILEHYKRILENIQDEEIRYEAAKILYTNYY